MARRGSKKNSIDARTESYSHPDATLIARPEAGQQSRFKKKKPKATYRYDSSLAPEMNWDGQNPAREHGEWLIACIEEAAKLADSKPPFTFAEPRHFASADGRITATVTGLADATEQLKRLSQPYLDWSGKAERLSFDVPTLPLFVHERLSTQAIIETLKSHRKDASQASMFELFGDPQRPLADAITKAYEHQDKWVNRLILGDSRLVMNSLLRYEGLGGQVQMIYMDPPYGVRFGSNFQPFVKNNRVSNDDTDFTREPEMVKAYRDTWELGLHSYLAYLRDRFIVARDLLHDSGSFFLQISDDHLHHVRVVMDEVFGASNFVALIAFQTATNQNTKTIQRLYDYLIWYAKDKENIKTRRVFRERSTDDIEGTFNNIDDDGRRFKAADISDLGDAEYEHLQKLGRITKDGKYGKRYPEDFPATEIENVWWGTVISTLSTEKSYVVQTSRPVVQRCIQLTTDPGDLVLDPTCGSGTTAYVAEQWGRRWITIDTSRVPLALARQRLMTSTFKFYSLRDPQAGPVAGFNYSRKINRAGDDVGGLVPHTTIKQIAKGLEPELEVIRDRPDEDNNVMRVSGPFCVEATIPTPLDLDGDGEPDDGSDMEERTSFVERMLDTLRRVGVLQLAGNRSVTLRNIRLPAKTLALSAEAMVDGMGDKPTLADVVTAADEAN